MRRTFYAEAVQSFDNGQEGVIQGGKGKSDKLTLKQTVSPDVVAAYYIMATEGVENEQEAQAMLLYDRSQGGDKYGSILEKIRKGGEDRQEVTAAIRGWVIQNESGGLGRMSEAQTGVPVPEYTGTHNTEIRKQFKMTSDIGDWSGDISDVPSLYGIGASEEVGVASKRQSIRAKWQEVLQAEHDKSVIKDEPWDDRTPQEAYAEFKETGRFAPKKKRKKKKRAVGSMRELRTWEHDGPMKGTTAYVPKGWSIDEDFSRGFRNGGEPTYNDIERGYLNHMILAEGPDALRRVDIARISRGAGDFEAEMFPLPRTGPELGPAVPGPVKARRQKRDPGQIGEDGVARIKGKERVEIGPTGQPMYLRAGDESLNEYTRDRTPTDPIYFPLDAASYDRPDRQLSSVGTDWRGNDITIRDILNHRGNIRKWKEQAGLKSGQLIPTRVISQGDEEALLWRMKNGQADFEDYWEVYRIQTLNRFAQRIDEQLAEERKDKSFLGMSYEGLDSTKETRAVGLFDLPDVSYFDLALNAADITANAVGAAVMDLGAQHGEAWEFLTEPMSTVQETMYGDVASPEFLAAHGMASDGSYPGGEGYRRAGGRLERILEATPDVRKFSRIRKVIDNLDGVRSPIEGMVDVWDLPDGKIKVTVTSWDALTEEEIAELPEGEQEEARKKSKPYEYIVLDESQLNVEPGSSVKADEVLFDGVHDKGLTVTQSQIYMHRQDDSEQFANWFENAYAKRFDAITGEEHYIARAFMTPEEVRAESKGMFSEWQDMGFWERVQAQPDRFLVNLSRNALETVAFLPVIKGYLGYRLIRGMGEAIEDVRWIDEQMWGDAEYGIPETGLRYLANTLMAMGVPLRGVEYAAEDIVFKDLPKIPMIFEYMFEEMGHPSRYFFKNPMDALGIASLATLPAKHLGKALVGKGALGPYESVLSKAGITYKSGKFMRAGEVLVDVAHASTLRGNKRVAAFRPLIDAMPEAYRAQLDDLVASVKPQYLAAALRESMTKAERGFNLHATSGRTARAGGEYKHIEDLKGAYSEAEAKSRRTTREGMESLQRAEQKALARGLARERALQRDWIEDRIITEMEAIAEQRAIWGRLMKQTMRTTGTLLQSAHDVWDPIQALMMVPRVGYGFARGVAMATSGSPDFIHWSWGKQKVDDFGRKVETPTGRPVKERVILDLHLKRLARWFQSPINQLDTYALRADGSVITARDLFRKYQARMAQSAQDTYDVGMAFPTEEMGEEIMRILSYEFDSGTEFFVAVHDNMLADTPYGRSIGMTVEEAASKGISETQRIALVNMQEMHSRILELRLETHTALAEMEDALAALPESLRVEIRRWQSGFRKEFPRQSKLAKDNADALKRYRDAARAHKKVEDKYLAKHEEYVNASIEYNTANGAVRYSGEKRLPEADNLNRLLVSDPGRTKIIDAETGDELVDTGYVSLSEYRAGKVEELTKKHARERVDLENRLNEEARNPVPEEELATVAPEGRAAYESSARAGLEQRHTALRNDQKMRHEAEFRILDKQLQKEGKGSAHVDDGRELVDPDMDGLKKGEARAVLSAVDRANATAGRGTSIGDMAVRFGSLEKLTYVPSSHVSASSAYRLWKGLKEQVRRVGEEEAGVTVELLEKYGKEWGFTNLSDLEMQYLDWVGKYMNATTLQTATGIYAARLPKSGEVIHVQQLIKPLRIASEMRVSLMNEGAKLVEAGVLPKEVYLANVGTYFPHLYHQSKKHIDGKPANKSIWEQGIKGDRLRRERNRELEYEQKVNKGLIKDFRLRYAMGLAQMKHDVEMAKLFNELSTSKHLDGPWQGYKLAEVASKGSGKEKSLKSMGWKKVPESHSWGSLAGKYVAPEMMYYLKFSQESREALNIYKKWMNRWKFGKTVLNPATHGRNVLSNMVLATMAGLNPWVYKSARFGWKNTRREVWRQEGVWYQRALEDGVLGTDMFSVELQGKMKNIFEPKFRSMGKMRNEFEASMEMVQDVMTWGEKAATKAKGIGDYATRCYQFEDEVFKVARYKQLWHLWEQYQKTGNLTGEMRRMFDSKDDAIYFMNLKKSDMRIAASRESHKWFFDYSDVSSAVDWARTWWAPFITFQVKALPRISQWMHKNPLKAFAYRKTFETTSMMLEYMDGMPDSYEEYLRREVHKESLPAYARIAAIGLPGVKTYEYADGADIDAMQWLDVQYWTPAGGVMSPDLSWKMSGWEEVIENQNPFNAAFNIWSGNRPPWDSAQGNLVSETDSRFEGYWKKLKETAKLAMPPLSPFGGSAMFKFGAALSGEPYPNTMQGRMLSIPEAVADGFAGVRTYKTRMDLNHIAEMRDEFVSRERELTRARNDKLRVPGVKGNKEREAEVLFEWQTRILEVRNEWNTMIDRLGYDAYLKHAVFGGQMRPRFNAWNDEYEETGRMPQEAIDYLLRVAR